MKTKISSLYHGSAAIVDLNCISHNLRVVKRKAPGRKIVAMVKANAYGHGLIKVAEYLLTQEIDYLGVAFVEEAVMLRKAGITAPIIVTGAFLQTQIKVFLTHNIDITVSSISALEEVEEAAKAFQKRAKIHLQIDTGMMRVGVRHSTAHNLLEAALKVKYCDVISVYSHLATADSHDLSFAYQQLERFLKVISFYEKNSLEPPLFHIANSAGVLRIPESYLDMVRPGLMLYGYHSSIYSEKEAELLPALSLRAKVAYFKVVPKGSSVGYGKTWTASENTRAVTLLIGYGDGYFRNLSNKGDVLINGHRCPIVGNISMDHTVVSLGSDGEAYKDDEAILIGIQGEEQITANELAKHLGTINYEVLTSINSRVPRIYISDGL